MNHNNLDSYQIVKECELQLAGAKIELSSILIVWTPPNMLHQFCTKFSQHNTESYDTNQTKRAVIKCENT